MQVWSGESVRRAALVGMVGAAGTVLAGVLVQAVVQPATTVPDDRWNYPWSRDAFAVASIVFALVRVLVLVGVLAFARSGVAGAGRAARVGLPLALAGTVLLTVAEIASIPFRGEQTDELGPGLVGGLFGLASLLSAVGFVAAGLATARSGAWAGARRYAPLAVGIAMAATIPFAPTKAMPTAIAVWGLTLLALTAALYTRPAAEAVDELLPVGGQAT